MRKNPRQSSLCSFFLILFSVGSFSPSGGSISAGRNALQWGLLSRSRSQRMRQTESGGVLWCCDDGSKTKKRFLVHIKERERERICFPRLELFKVSQYLVNPFYFSSLVLLRDAVSCLIRFPVSYTNRFTLPYSILAN